MNDDTMVGIFFYTPTSRGLDLLDNKKYFEHSTSDEDYISNDHFVKLPPVYKVNFKHAAYTYHGDDTLVVSGQHVMSPTMIITTSPYNHKLQKLQSASHRYKLSDQVMLSCFPSNLYHAMKRNSRYNMHHLSTFYYAKESKDPLNDSLEDRSNRARIRQEFMEYVFGNNMLPECVTELENEVLMYKEVVFGSLLCKELMKSSNGQSRMYLEYVDRFPERKYVSEFKAFLKKQYMERSNDTMYRRTFVLFPGMVLSPAVVKYWKQNACAMMVEIESFLA
jgi:hypothetical protein